MNIPERILTSLLVIFLVVGAMSEYCDPLYPAPCHPIVTQEDVTMAVVDWSLLWPDLTQGCVDVEAVTVVANGNQQLSCKNIINHSPCSLIHENLILLLFLDQILKI
jgi:hypothetical protein